MTLFGIPIAIFDSLTKGSLPNSIREPTAELIWRRWAKMNGYGHIWLAIRTHLGLFDDQFCQLFACDSESVALDLMKNGNLFTFTVRKANRDEVQFSDHDGLIAIVSFLPNHGSILDCCVGGEELNALRELIRALPDQVISKEQYCA